MIFKTYLLLFVGSHMTETGPFRQPLSASNILGYNQDRLCQPSQVPDMTDRPLQRIIMGPSPGSDGL